MRIIIITLTKIQEKYIRKRNSDLNVFQIGSERKKSKKGEIRRKKHSIEKVRKTNFFLPLLQIFNRNPGHVTLLVNS